jgi:hypothetical protein
MNNPGKCLICGVQVHPSEQENHLRAAHPGPFKFWHDGREFETRRPSMMVLELKQLVKCTPTYQLFEEREGHDVAQGDGVAVDLTHEPHFFSIPPATMCG